MNGQINFHIGFNLSVPQLAVPMDQTAPMDLFNVLDASGLYMQVKSPRTPIQPTVLVFPQTVIDDSRLERRLSFSCCPDSSCGRLHLSCSN